MKAVKLVAFLLLAATLLGTAVSAQPAHNWFFKATESGKQPIVFGGNKMPDKYGAIYMGNERDKVIYLTFDAGYGCESLDMILQTLKEHEVKASFFILPAVIKYAMPTLEKMIADGHLIANHSYSHANMAQVADIERFKKELTDLEDYYRAQTGNEMTKFFRPPEGAFTEQTLMFCKQLGYTPVFWSFAYADWDNGKQPDTAAALRRLTDGAHNGAVYLLHPNSMTNALILGDFQKEMKGRGYTFKTIDRFEEGLKPQAFPHQARQDPRNP